MCSEIWLVFFLVACTYIQGCRGQDVVLSSDPLDQWEHTNVTLTCVSHLLYPGSFMWNVTTSQSEKLESYVTRECIALSSWLANNELYAVNCNTSVTSVTIKNISQTRHGEKWKCYALTSTLSYGSNTLQIFVKVPVKTVSISPHTEIFTTVEKRTFFWQCNTSLCRPAPRFIWYKRAGSNGENIVISNVSADNSLPDNLVSYSNTYSIRLNRSWDGYYVFCGAHNGVGSVVQSRQILFNVVYPPDGPPMIEQLETGSTINVIKNRSINLACSVSGGNPLPTIEWNENNDTPQTVSGNTVTKTLTWKANDTNDHELICNSTHQLNNDTTYVLAKVLFPPETTEVNLNLYTENTSNILQKFSVIENTSNTMTLICTARSNPLPSSYRWTGPVQSNSAMLELNMTRHVQGTYTCNVINTMIAYDRYIENGYITAFYTIEILQSPNIEQLENVTVVEGEDFRIECPIISGNDTWRSVKWVNNQSIPIAQNGSLFMNNVRRLATGIYTCQMDFSMQPTYGFTINETITRGLYLDVFYKAEIASFSINNEVSSLTVNETDRVHFICHVDSNPSPKTELIFHNQVLSTEINTRTLDYSILSVSCTHAGTYACTASNNYNRDQPAIKNYTLFVNCSPRQSPSFELTQNVTSIINGTATFRFTTMAFPKPSFRWYRILNNSKTSDVHRGVIEHYPISINEMQIYLILVNVEYTHFGEYVLNIENQYGTFNQTYFLLAEAAELPREIATTSGSVVTVIGVAVGGFFAGMAFTALVLLCRKRFSSQTKRARAQDNVYSLKDSQTYQDFPEEGHTLPDSTSFIEYEGLQHTGSEADQRYKQVEVFNNKNETEPRVKVYDNLLVSHQSKDSNVGVPSSANT